MARAEWHGCAFSFTLFLAAVPHASFCSAADEDEGQDKEQGELSEPKTDTFETEDQLTTVTTVTDLDLDLDSRYGSAAEEDDDDDDDVGKDGGKKQDYEKKAKKLEHQLQRLNQYSYLHPRKQRR